MAAAASSLIVHFPYFHPDILLLAFIFFHAACDRYHAIWTNMDWEDAPTSETAPVPVSSILPPSPYHTRLHDNAFRVVHIAPGHWREPIKGRLSYHSYGMFNSRDVSIVPPCAYKALSYAWGSCSVKEVIYLENMPVKVTMNLFCALKYLRRADQSVSLWIDALVTLSLSLYVSVFTCYYT